MNRITNRITPLALLAVTACASQPQPATQATAPQPFVSPAAPVTASVPPSNPDLPRQHDFLTALPVRDASQQVLTALCQKLFLGTASNPIGSNVQIEIGSPNSTLVAYAQNADYFSAVSELTTSGGNKVRVDCEWITDGKTRVTVQSDLSRDRFAVVERVVSDSLANAAPKSPQ